MGSDNLKFFPLNSFPFIANKANPLSWFFAEIKTKQEISIISMKIDKIDTHFRGDRFSSISDIKRLINIVYIIDNIIDNIPGEVPGVWRSTLN